MWKKVLVKCVLRLENMSCCSRCLELKRTMDLPTVDTAAVAGAVAAAAAA